MNYPTPQVLAAEFCRQMHEQLCATHMEEVVLLNAQETNPLVCHSHDFCDANVVMFEAFTEVCDAPEDDEDFDISDQVVLDLMNAAWSIAKKADFDAELCEAMLEVA